jgi:hypothetical protein
MQPGCERWKKPIFLKVYNAWKQWTNICLTQEHLFYIMAPLKLEDNLWKHDC